MINNKQVSKVAAARRKKNVAMAIEARMGKRTREKGQNKEAFTKNALCKA